MPDSLKQVIVGFNSETYQVVMLLPDLDKQWELTPDNAEAIGNMLIEKARQARVAKAQQFN